MSKKEPKYLLWWDCETTGLDHVMDPMLEVAVLVTDMNLTEIPNKRFHAIMDPGPWGFDRLDENPYVKNMHTENGLLEEIKRGHPMMAEGVEASIRSMLHSLDLGEDECILLAGSGVAAFDMQVISNQMPLLGESLDYRTIDVGHLRRFLKNVVGLPEDYMPPEADDSHRAQGDVLNALEQARAFQALLNGAR